MDNIIEKKCKISDAIKVLNSSSIKSLIVLDKKKFLGTVTDGDIRRGLINKINIDANILKIANKKSITTFKKKINEKLRQKMINKKIYCLPIIAKNKTYIGFHNIFEKTQSETNNDSCVVIMAGGKGERLLPLTKKIPKPMIKIKGKPIIEIIINKILKDDLKKIFVTTHYKAKIIENYFKNKKRYTSNLSFIRDKKPLGTIGSLSMINLKNYDHCIVTNADILSNFMFGDVLKYHKLNNSDLTITTYIKKVTSDYGNLTLKGKMIHNFKEKPSHIQNISVGIYVVKTDLLKYLNKNEYCDVPTFINRLIKKKKEIMSYPIHEDWIDVGTKENLRLAKMKFKKKLFK